MQNCENCGASFKRRHRRHIFCSGRCRTKSHRRKHGIPEIPDFNNLSNYTPSYSIPSTPVINQQPKVIEKPPIESQKVLRSKLILKKRGKVSKSEKFPSKGLKKKKKKSSIKAIVKEYDRKKQEEIAKNKKEYSDTIKSMIPNQIKPFFYGDE